MKVALVDDDAAVRSSLRLLLAGRGYDVDVFAGGQAVLDAKLGDDHFCLLADYLMPDIDGISLLGMLRKQGWVQPALLITGHFDSGFDKRAVAAGYSAVFEKPLHSERLINAVAKFAGG
jgi:two-component system, LuxR family, response regulator FixJ